jgi:hypothetical protein
MYQHSINKNPCTSTSPLTYLYKLTTTNYSLACNSHIVTSKYFPHIHMYLELTYNIVVNMLFYFAGLFRVDKEMFSHIFNH